MSVLVGTDTLLPPIFGGLHPAFDVMILPDGTEVTYFAGGPVNAALAAGLIAPHVGLYQKVRLATVYGSKNPPNTAEFREVGIRFYGLVVPGELRGNRVDLRRGCQAEPEHGVSDLQITPGHVRTYRRFFASVRPRQVVAFTGSLPGDEDSRHKVTPQEYAELILWVLVAKGARIIIDARPKILRVILDHLKAVLGEESEHFARVFIKQNRSEFRDLIGQHVHLNGNLGDWATHARATLKGASFIITRGGEGTLLVTPGEVSRLWLRPEDEPNVVKTDACGDSQVAGTAVGLALNMSLIEAARLGMGVAQANTETIGPGRICPERALELAGQIIVDPVN